MSAEERHLEDQLGQEPIDFSEADDEIMSQEIGQGSNVSGNFAPYTVKLPSEQLAALQSIWLELKRLYGTHSPDKSGMIQQAIAEWLKKWDGPDRKELLTQLLEIRQDTRRRQYKKDPDR